MCSLRMRDVWIWNTRTAIFVTVWNPFWRRRVFPGQTFTQSTRPFVRGAFTLSCFNCVRRISLTHIARKITWKSTLDYKLDYDENLISLEHRYEGTQEISSVYSCGWRHQRILHGTSERRIRFQFFWWWRRCRRRCIRRILIVCVVRFVVLCVCVYSI